MLPKSADVTYTGELVVLKLESWMRFMAENNVWHALCGLHKPDAERERAILEAFWRNYRALHPTHKMWDLVDSGRLDVSRCAPLLLHGDEGRGRKKTPFLCISFHSVLGFGTTSANSQRTRRPYASMRLNFSGSSWLHRLLSAVLPKMTRDEQALEDLLKCSATSAIKMMEEGVSNGRGQQFFAVVLNVVGDWAWMVKSGCLNRSYQNVQKVPLTARSQPKGICHQCLAGRPNIPFENFRTYGGDGEHPDWWPSMCTESPFSRRPALLDIPYIPGEEPCFWSFDLFHGKDVLRCTDGNSFGANGIVQYRRQNGRVDGTFDGLL